MRFWRNVLGLAAGTAAVLAGWTLQANEAGDPVEEKPAGYAVIVSEAVCADPDWNAAANALEKRHAKKKSQQDAFGHDDSLDDLDLDELYDVDEYVDVSDNEAPDGPMGRHRDVSSVRPPISSNKVVGLHYEDVAIQMQASGFTNIILSPIRDLVKGWLIKDGSVASMSINGKTNYRKLFAKYDRDVPVIIRYHTFKK